MKISALFCQSIRYVESLVMIYLFAIFAYWDNLNYKSRIRTLSLREQKPNQTKTFKSDDFINVVKRKTQ